MKYNFSNLVYLLVQTKALTHDKGVSEHDKIPDANVTMTQDCTIP